MRCWRFMLESDWLRGLPADKLPDWRWWWTWMPPLLGHTGLVCSANDAQAPYRGIARSKIFRAADRRRDRRSPGGQRLVCKSMPNQRNQPVFAINSAISKKPEFLVVRSSGISDFSTNWVGGHLFWVFIDWWWILENRCLIACLTGNEPIILRLENKI